MIKTWFILIAIFALGLFFRIYHLNGLPSEMHRDEVAIGYNAYSILRTGRDEHGQGPHPLVFISFGDYKLPGLIYLTAASVHFLGLTPWAVRLPTAMMAALLIPSIFFFVRELWPDRKIAFAAALLVATSFVNIFTAHTAYEPAVGLTLHIIALTCLLAARRRGWLFGPSLLFFGLSFMTYNVPLLIAPVLVLVILYLWQSEYLKNKKSLILAMGGFALIWAAFFYSFTSVLSGKLGTTIFTNPPILKEISQRQIDMTLSGVSYRISSQLLGNWPELLQNFLQKYLRAFDLGFLFFEGGSNHWHSLGHIRVGNFSLILLPVIILGFLGLAAKLKSSASQQFLLFYLLWSAVPNGLTIDSPVTNRLMDFQVVLLVIAAYGSVSTYKYLVSKNLLVLRSTIVAFSLGFIFLFSRFWLSYAQLFNRYLDISWGEGVTQLAEKVATVWRDYDTIYITHDTPPGLPEVEIFYIYLAFFTRLDPAIFQQTAVWKQDTDFQRVRSFERFIFQKPEGILAESQVVTQRESDQSRKKILYLEWIPTGQSPKSDAVFVITNSQGKPSWQATEITLQH